ncbi:hypothetical protein ADK34_35580 [Streptomyces viridochromogenes]|uniref:Putative zinc-finger domain-containing protein n=2 Tax=Streptomyces TaxID=1883 RepID=A0A0L8J9A2_STRVR|nr:hypothetical protein ADK34_35580 [Streptomyces viridochromogenes]
MTESEAWRTDMGRMSLGAYVLGALTEEGDRLVAEHLRACDRCTADYLDLSEAANLLTLIDEADLAAGKRPSGGGEADGEGPSASPVTT